MSTKLLKNKITVILLLINTLYFLIGILKYGINLSAFEAYQHGAFLPSVIIEYNDYWRLITANFVHFNIVHFIMNSYALLQVGVACEMLLTKKHYLNIVLFSMVTTTLIPLLLFLTKGTYANVVSGGFSGVISGMFGALLYFSYKYRYLYNNLYKQIKNNILLMILISLIPSVSMIGHISGFLGGLIVSYFMLE